MIQNNHFLGKVGKDMSILIQSIFERLSSIGYLDIALGLMVEVIPSEIVIADGGYLNGKIKNIKLLITEQYSIGGSSCYHI